MSRSRALLPPKCYKPIGDELETSCYIRLLPPISAFFRQFRHPCPLFRSALHSFSLCILYNDTLSVSCISYNVILLFRFNCYFPVIFNCFCILSFHIIFMIWTRYIHTFLYALPKHWPDSTNKFGYKMEKGGKALPFGWKYAMILTSPRGATL